MALEIRHRSTGPRKSRGELVLDRLSIDELMESPDAPALRERIDANTPRDWCDREQHICLVTALILRVRMVAASKKGAS